MMQETENQENQQDEVEARATRIREYLKQIDERNRKNLEDVIKVGFILRQANHIIPHSEFGKWVQENFRFTLAEAVHYMEASQGYEQWLPQQTKVSEEYQTKD